MNKPRAGLINYVTEHLSYYTKKIPASRNNEISILFDRIVAFWFKECPLLMEKSQRFYLNAGLQLQLLHSVPRNDSSVVVLYKHRIFFLVKPSNRQATAIAVYV